ncbi:hypothetical protein SAMD00019534_097580, partial [Acytostelium subglobosum LB1]|uniref:hypothetical protein n=1 Tax=Acytostelium subglobosum LB1 TaxID=1410327 RepID=UPI000644BFD5
MDINHNNQMIPSINGNNNTNAYVINPNIGIGAMGSPMPMSPVFPQIPQLPLQQLQQQLQQQQLQQQQMVLQQLPQQPQPYPQQLPVQSQQFPLSPSTSTIPNNPFHHHLQMLQQMPMAYIMESGSAATPHNNTPVSTPELVPSNQGTPPSTPHSSPFKTSDGMPMVPPSSLGILDSPRLESSLTQPNKMFRNFYHNIEFYVADPEVQLRYQNMRIYIADTVGYSGNAKKFINKPQINETALCLDAQVLDCQFNPLGQCPFCKEYFQSRFYFANNPQCKEKLVLVKSNVTTYLKNGYFSAQIKIMCCSKHHSNNNLVVHLWLRDCQTNEVICSAAMSSFIKQWKRSKSPTAASNNNNQNGIIIS